MAQQFQTQPNGSPFKTQSKQTAQLQTVASPVDTYVRPKDDPLFGLVDALSSLQPSLQAYQDNRDASLMDEGRAMYLKGEQLQGSEPDKKVKGYRQLMWGEKARNAHVAVDEAIEKAKVDPEWMAANAHDPQGGIQNIIKSQIAKDLEGEQDPEMIKAYSDRMIPLLDTAPIAFAKYHREELAKETKAAMGRHHMDVLHTEGSAEEQRAMYDASRPTFEALGISKVEQEETFVDALIARADEANDPKLLNMADVKDKDGHAMSDSPALKSKLLTARERIVKDEHAFLLKQTQPARQEWHGNFKMLLETDPMNPQLDPVNLAKEVHEYGALAGDNEWGNAIQEVMNARKAHLKEEAAKYYMPPMEQWSLVSQTPEFKKVYDEEDAAIVRDIKWEDPNSVRGALELLKLRQEKSTRPSNALKGLLGSFSTAAIDPKTGEVPPNLMTAFQVYKFFEKSNPKLLEGLMDEGSLLMADRISREMGTHSIAPISMAQAVERITKASTMGNKRNADAVAKDGTLTKSVESAINDKFSSKWWKPGDSGMANFDNRGLMTEARQRVNTLIIEHGYKDAEAVERAVMEIEAKYAPDGHSSFVEVPLGYNKEDIAKGTEQFLTKYARNNGASNRFLKLNADGKTYTLKDALTGQDLRDDVKPAELLGINRPITYADPVKQEKLMMVATKLITGIKDGSLNNMGDFIDANYGEVNELLKGDTFTMIQGIRLKGFMERRDMEHSQKTKMSFHQLIKDNSNFLAPKLYDSKTPLSTSMEATRYAGSPGNVTELAAHYYKKSPIGAMIMDAEGLRLSPYKDSDGGLAIGFGWNLGKHTRKENEDALRAAGVSTDDIKVILTGKIPKGKDHAINTEQAIKLLEHTMTPYKEKAQQVYGGGWSLLPDTAQAVLIDMAYNTGNPAQFRKVIDLMKANKLDEVSKNLTLKYTDKATGKKVDNKRRIQIWREMLSGQYGNILAKKAAKPKRK